MERREQLPLDPRVVLIGGAAAMSSGVALVISILTDSPLWMASSFVFVPGLIALTALSVMARRDEQPLFLTRLRAGAIAGVLATAAYDVVRWFVEWADLAGTKSFLAIRAFGVSLTGRPPGDFYAEFAGWAFHVCNGVGFAIAFMFVGAGRHWAWAILFALGLEAAMVLLYPGWLGITLSKEFLSVSITGHVAYGAVLGGIARRTA